MAHDKGQKAFAVGTGPVERWGQAPVEAVVAGAGLWGCTVARRLAEAGKRVLVVEKRPSIGGNCRCEIDPETGIEVHAYGSHIFHTHIPEVWAFVNRFTTFNGYQHKVLAWTKARGHDRPSGGRRRAEGAMYHLPLGLALVNKFFGVELRPSEIKAFLADPRRKTALFDAFFRGYTSKQWGQAPEEIDPAVIRRVPVRENYDTNYFNDMWQGIPSDGYNALFARLLDHPNIAVRTCVSLTCEDGRLVLMDERTGARDSMSGLGRLGSAETVRPLPVYYSGPLDALFGYRFGALPWRTLRFERQALGCRDYQGTSVVNYPDLDVPYTRIHEFKHYHPEREEDGARRLVSRWGYDAPKTVIMKEYSAAWQPGDEPYYPIANAASAALLARYQDEVAAFNRRSSVRLVVGGRLGQYRYLDMDRTVEAALKASAPSGERAVRQFAIIRV